jgi:hypothetical protein
MVENGGKTVPCRSKSSSENREAMCLREILPRVSSTAFLREAQSSGEMEAAWLRREKVMPSDDARSAMKAEAEGKVGAAGAFL